MPLFEKKETAFSPEMYKDYQKTDAENLCLREITEEEYSALDDSCKSRLRLFFTLPGLALIGCSALAGYMLIEAVGMIARHEKNGWMGLFISVMVGMFVIILSVAALMRKMDRLVTRRSLVLAGEVVGMKLIRGHRHSVTGAEHAVAVHGSRQIVWITDDPPIEAGNTVLIVKSPGLAYHLFRISPGAAEFSRTAGDWSAEIRTAGEIPDDDYSRYSKVSFNAAWKYPFSESEYYAIPPSYRVPNPFTHGFVSVFWVIFSLITAALAGGLIYSRITHNSDMFVVMVICLCCDLFIEWLLTKYVLRVKLPKNMTYCVECVPIKKTKSAGHCIISAVIPEKKQYIDYIEVDHSLYDRLGTNEPVRLYFLVTFPVAQYAARVYDSSY